jgi:hypothetical protein
VYGAIAPPHDDTAHGDRHARYMALALHDRPTDAPAAASQRRRDERPWFPLGRRAHRALLVSHVLSAVGWFGLALTVAFVAVVGGRADDVAYSEVIGSTLWLSIPLGVAAAVTGLALSVTTRWGLVRHWWVVAKEVITVAVIATDVLVVWPAMDRAVDTGTPGSIPGPIYAHCVVLAIATALSVVKPKARTPLPARRAA